MSHYLILYIRLDWDRWVMMGLIGLCVGIIGFLLHQVIDVIADLKWEKANEFIKVKLEYHFLYFITNVG